MVFATDVESAVRFCAAFGFADLAADPALATNAGRIEQRATLMPRLQSELAKLPSETVIARCRQAVVPVTRVAKPEDLFTDPHLNANGAMAEIALSETVRAMLPLLPITMEGIPLGVRRQPPAAGEATEELLREIGVDAAEEAVLRAKGVVG